MKCLADPLFWIAIWGGITGTIAIIFTGLSYRKDRSELSIDTSLSLYKENVDLPVNWRFEVILRNKGRRTCYVERVGIELTLKSIQYGETKFNPAGPMVFHLYKGCEKGIIRLEESTRQSIVIFPFLDVYLEMMRASNKDIGILLVVDSLGKEFRHTFPLPPRNISNDVKHITNSPNQMP